MMPAGIMSASMLPMMSPGFTASLHEYQRMLVKIRAPGQLQASCLVSYSWERLPPERRGHDHASAFKEGCLMCLGFRGNRCRACEQDGNDHSSSDTPVE
jgi:hypothetical protein